MIRGDLITVREMSVLIHRGMLQAGIMRHNATRLQEQIWHAWNLSSFIFVYRHSSISILQNTSSSLRHFELLKLTYFMYHQFFDIQQFCVLPTIHLCVLRGSQKKKRDYSLYSITLSVFITEAECLLRGTDWVFKSYRYSFVLKWLITDTCLFVCFPAVTTHCGCIFTAR
jgi:hypothetical protein